MKTGETVTDLGLYSSECCSDEVVFDIGDTLTRCPACHELCEWECEEELEPCDYRDNANGMVA